MWEPTLRRVASAACCARRNRSWSASCDRAPGSLRTTASTDVGARLTVGVNAHTATDAQTRFVATQRQSSASSQ